MAPAASILTSGATAASTTTKRPAASDAEDSSALPQQQGEGDHKSQPRQPPKQQLECPRCRSTNTKFCYYNNYSLSQPRHFCRACRRYWTHGGTLRDVPVGGATRRCKRRRLSSADPPPALVEDACTPDLASPHAAFPFLSDGSYLLPPSFDLGLFAPPAVSSSGVPDFFDGIAPWDEGTLGVTAGAWGCDIAGLELTWPPPGN